MLTLPNVQRALRSNMVEISAHAEMRMFERDIPIYSILHALPRLEATARLIVDKHDATTSRLCVDVAVNGTMYSLIFGDSTNVITLITEYRDRIHVSHEDEYYSMGDLLRRAG